MLKNVCLDCSPARTGVFLKGRGSLMNFYRCLVVALFCLFILIPANATTEVAERGIQLFVENKPAEAAPVLELASRQSGADELVFLYLGIAYLQLSRYDDALAAFRRGMAVAVAYRHLFHFNIGNTFFMQNRNAFALDSFTQAIAANSAYAPAYLNRANVQMRLGDTSAAVSDYGLYLSLDPGSSQAGEIRRLLDILNSKIATAMQQEALAKARKEAEEKARAELMASVTQSLLDAATATTNLSAGSAGVEGYSEVFSLDD
jgi:tetratricopeptide (TPR) repeat protein